MPIFVDRQDELDFLEFALKRAHAGHGQVVAVVGEPGVGKSRLLVEFGARCRADGWQVLAAEAPPGGELSSHLSVVQLLRAQFSLDDPTDARPAAEKLDAALAEASETLGRSRAALFSVLDLPVDDPAWAGLDTSLRRQRILDAVAEALIHGSADRPRVVVCESLQWIDPESQACLDALVGRLARARVLLVVSHRPEYTPPWGSLPYYNPLGLPPLSSGAAADLLVALVGPDPRLEPVTSVLVEHTGGNPLFIEECVRALSETGVLAGEAGPGEETAPLTELQGLATVQAVLASRMRRLAPEDQRLLETASVIGTRIPVPILEAVAGLSAEALARGLARLEAAEFLQQTGPFAGVEVSFHQPLMHEVAYAAMSPERRRALHADALAAMEALGPDHPAARPDVLGEHAFRGEIWDRAVALLRQAGGRAAGRTANGEAAGRLEQALAALAHLPEERATQELGVDIRLELRPPLLQMGRLPDVLRVSREAEALAQRIGDEARLARVYTYLANYHYLKGEHDNAIGYGELCVGIGEARHDAALVALARAYMGYSLHAQGRVGDAETVLARNVEMLEALRPEDKSAQTAVSHVGSAAWLAFALADLGEFERAERAAESARRISGQTRNPYSQAIATTLGGLVWLARGDLDRALPPLEASLAACRDKQLVLWHPVPASLLGAALARAGRLERALPLLEDGVARTRGLGVIAYLARWTVHLGEGLLAAGRHGPAAEAARAALDLATRHHERGNEAEALRLAGELAAGGDAPDGAEAARRYREALEIAEALQLQPLAARCHAGLGALGGRGLEPREARRHLVRAIELGRVMGLGVWLDQAVATLRPLGHLFIVPRGRPELHALLRERWAGDAGVQVVIDRRQVPRALSRGSGPAEGVVFLDG